jgi:hypothetical protein
MFKDWLTPPPSQHGVPEFAGVYLLSIISALVLCLEHGGCFSNIQPGTQHLTGVWFSGKFRFANFLFGNTRVQFPVITFISLILHKLRKICIFFTRTQPIKKIKINLNKYILQPPNEPEASQNL